MSTYHSVEQSLRDSGYRRDAARRLRVIGGSDGVTGPARDYDAHRESMNRELRLDPHRTVVLTIDMQRAYLDPSVGDKLVPRAEAESIIAASARLLDACRSLAVPIVHTYVSRLPVELAARVGSSRFATLSRSWDGGDHVDEPDRPADSAKAEVPAALVGEGDIHIRSKKTTDCYYGTELSILFEQAIRPKTVVILGINTETCVYAGSFGTKVRGYWPVVASDCVASHRDPENTRLALELMSRTIAWTLPSDEIIARLRVG